MTLVQRGHLCIGCFVFHKGFYVANDICWHGCIDLSSQGWTNVTKLAAFPCMGPIPCMETIHRDMQVTFLLPWWHRPYAANLNLHVTKLAALTPWALHVFQPLPCISTILACHSVVWPFCTKGTVPTTMYLHSLCFPSWVLIPYIILSVVPCVKYVLLKFHFCVILTLPDIFAFSCVSLYCQHCQLCTEKH